MDPAQEAVRVVKAMEKKDASAKGAPQNLKIDDAVYLKLLRNEQGQPVKVNSLRGDLSIRSGSEGRVTSIPPGRADAVEVEFWKQGTGLFERNHLAKMEGVEVDQDGLNKVLELLHGLQRDMRGEELEVSIVAIMGKFRHGKSFLLNLLVQYFEWLEMEWLHEAGVNDEGAMVSLDAGVAAGSGKRGLYFCGRTVAGIECAFDGSQCDSCKRYQEKREPMPSGAAGSRTAPACGEPPPWWNPEMPVPQGFKVQRQAETCTKGIEIYPRPFLLRRRGKQTAVLLMDSQGAFDGMINEKQSQTIFALTAGLASNVIYNFKGNIGEENLKHMTEVGHFVKTALSLTGTSDDGLRTPAEQRPLGSLSFMLRDFDYPYPDGKCDENVTWEARSAKAEEELARFEREAAVLDSSFRSVKLAWLSHPGQEVEQGRSCNLRFANVKPLFMQLLDEFVWHTFERPDAAFPFPSRSIVDGVPLTTNNFMAHIENLRAMLFDCDLKMAPPRWMAMQLLKKERDDFQAELEESMRLDLPRLEHIAAGGFGGYYTSDLDDFYTISKLVQIQDRVVATSEKCPGNPSTGTVKGNILHMQGGSGTLAGDEITWSSGEPQNCFLCVPPLEPQVWVRQALTKEQVATAESELEGQREALHGADGELARRRSLAEQALQDRLASFQDKIAHLLQASQGEQQGFVQDLGKSLGECVEARVLDGRATIAHQETEVANRRVELAGQRERIAVLEAKMAKAELAHMRGEAPEKAPRPPRAPSFGFPFCSQEWSGYWQSH